MVTTDPEPFAILRHVPPLVDAVAGHPRPVVLIDGRSGSGKTTLAAVLAASLPGAQLVRLDDLYPGWDGLATASTAVAETVLSEASPGWREWDWSVSRPGDWHELDPTRPLVIEGCGALSRAAKARSTFAVWVELDAEVRRARAIARDGETYAPHWERWARQEEAFMARENPRALADLVIEESAS